MGVRGGGGCNTQLTHSHLTPPPHRHSLPPTSPTLTQTLIITTTLTISATLILNITWFFFTYLVPSPSPVKSTEGSKRLRLQKHASSSDDASSPCLTISEPLKLTIPCSDASLYDAALRGDHAAVETAINIGASVDWHCAAHRARTSLHAAAKLGDTTLLKRLLRNSIDPTSLDLDNNSAIMVAAASGHVECVRLLIQFNHNIELSNGKVFIYFTVQSIFSRIFFLTRFQIETLLHRCARINAHLALAVLLPSQIDLIFTLGRDNLSPMACAVGAHALECMQLFADADRSVILFRDSNSANLCHLAAGAVLKMEALGCEAVEKTNTENLGKSRSLSCLEWCIENLPASSILQGDRVLDPAPISSKLLASKPSSTYHPIHVL